MTENNTDADGTGRLWIVSRGGDYDGTHPIAIRESAETARERAKEEIPDDVEFDEYSRENDTYLARWIHDRIVKTTPVEDIDVGCCVDGDIDHSE